MGHGGDWGRWQDSKYLSSHDLDKFGFTDGMQGGLIG